MYIFFIKENKWKLTFKIYLLISKHKIFLRIQRFLSQRVKSRLLWHQTVEGRQTLLKLILGSLHASQGLINNSAKNNDTYVLFDNLELYKNLTGMDNILFFTNFRYSKLTIKKRAQRYLSEERLSKRVSTYSLGEGKRLSLIIWNLLEPSLTMMDEVTNGLDYESLNILKEDLIRSKNEKIILLTGHQFEFYEEIIDDLYVIKNKKILKVDKGGLKKIYESNFN